MCKLLVSVCVCAVLVLTNCREPSETTQHEQRGAVKVTPAPPVNSTVTPMPATLQSEPPLPDQTKPVGLAATARLFLVILDSSTSYKDYERVIQGLLSAVKNLGPGDRLVIARITGKFDPKVFIVLDASTPRPRTEILTPSPNIGEWKQKQRQLDGAWQKVAENVRTINPVLQRLKGANTALMTDLHGALEYSAVWLNSQPAEEKMLVICSDLEHDTGKPTFDPPAASPLDVNNVRVELLYITYKDVQHWKKIEAAWKKYFSRAAGFEMLDSGRSFGDAMVIPSPVPRQLPNPLQTRPGN